MTHEQTRDLIGHLQSSIQQQLDSGEAFMQQMQCPSPTSLLSTQDMSATSGDIAVERSLLNQLRRAADSLRVAVSKTTISRVCARHMLQDALLRFVLSSSARRQKTADVLLLTEDAAADLADMEPYVLVSPGSWQQLAVVCGMC